MNPEVRVFQDLERLSRAAAQLLTGQGARAIHERDRFLVALSGGSTPVRLFQLLAADYRDQIAWGQTHVFWGDERCVPPEDPESSYGQARQALLSHVHLPEANVHRIQGDLGPAEAARDYAHVLKRFASPPLDWPRFDLALLGMGEDGHTASLFPGSPVRAGGPVIGVSAHYQNRPVERVTLTPPVFNSARMVLFMATGTNKAAVLSQVLGDSYQPERLPAQRIHPEDGELIWLLDEGAASKLPGKSLNSQRAAEG